MLCVCIEVFCVCNSMHNYYVDELKLFFWGGELRFRKAIYYHYNYFLIIIIIIIIIVFSS